MKAKNHMIILTDAKKLSAKFNTYLWQKKKKQNASQNGHRKGTYLNIIKTVSPVNILGGETQAFSLRLKGTRERGVHAQLYSSTWFWMSYAEINKDKEIKNSDQKFHCVQMT